MQRRDVELIGLGLLVAPPLAAVLFLAATGVARHGLQGLYTLDLGFLVGTFPFSYVIALVPALVAMTGNAFLARLVRGQGLRLLLALPIGAIPFLIDLGFLASDEGGGPIGAEMLGLGLAGALASLVCVALVEAFGTPLRGES